MDEDQGTWCHLFTRTPFIVSLWIQNCRYFAKIILHDKDISAKTFLYGKDLCISNIILLMTSFDDNLRKYFDNGGATQKQSKPSYQINIVMEKFLLTCFHFIFFIIFHFFFSLVNRNTHVRDKPHKTCWYHVKIMT